MEMVQGMLHSGAVVERDGRVHAAADHTPVAAADLEAVPFPRDWPPAGEADTGVA